MTVLKVPHKQSFRKWCNTTGIDQETSGATAFSQSQETEIRSIWTTIIESSHLRLWLGQLDESQQSAFKWELSKIEYVQFLDR